MVSNTINIGIEGGITMHILDELNKLKDEQYKIFNEKLVPNQKILGVSIPKLRSLAKRLIKENRNDVDLFLVDLPHTYLEENHLHVLILMEIKDIEELFQKANLFLPYLNNWQTTDLFTPKIIKCNDDKTKIKISTMLLAEEEYVRRSAIRLMLYRGDFADSDIEAVIEAGKSNYYYVQMAAAWYLSMAFLENRRKILESLNLEIMSETLLKKTIQKIIESSKVKKDDKNLVKNIKSKYIKK